jgi:hypothetical protein
MRSRVYHQGRYAAEQEMCLHHFHRLLAGTMERHLDAWDAQHDRDRVDGIGNGNGERHRAHVEATP